MTMGLIPVVDVGKNDTDSILKGATALWDGGRFTLSVRTTQWLGDASGGVGIARAAARPAATVAQAAIVFPKAALDAPWTKLMT